LQELIVKTHNDMRNQVAGGNVTGYEGARLPTAVRMATTRWSDQLAYFASLHAMRCESGHDICRKSAAFRWAGQNIAGFWASGSNETSPSFNTSEFLVRMIKMWFNEHRHVLVNESASVYPIYSNGSEIGHFTVIVTELSTHVGCAVMHYTNDVPRNHVLICNYAFTNLAGFANYRIGPTASKCTTGRNPVYNNLCSIDEVFNVNPYT
jgi:hypothetical protein